MNPRRPRGVSTTLWDCLRDSRKVCLIAAFGRTAQGACAARSIGIDTLRRGNALPKGEASRQEARYKAGR